MIATRFTADQLVISTEHTRTEDAKRTAAETISLCKLIQHVYPDARFAVDGRSGKLASNEIDYRGRIDVFTSVDGEWAGRIDVELRSNWNGGNRFQFQGPYVDKGNARYWGDGKVWRKDAIKLAQALQAQNAIRGKNPVEAYSSARDAVASQASSRLYDIDWKSCRLLRLCADEGLALAAGKAPSAELAELLNAARTEWPEIVRAVTAEAMAEDAALAAKHGVEAWGIDPLDHRSSIRKVLETLK